MTTRPATSAPSAAAPPAALPMGADPLSIALAWDRAVRVHECLRLAAEFAPRSS